MWNAERIKQLRARYRETQDQFRKRLGVEIHTLRHWEQGKGEPIGPACFLLDRLAEDMEAGKPRPIPELQSA